MRRARKGAWVGFAARCVVVAAVALAAVRTAHADGCYIPEKAYKKLPAIPAQRAFIRHRDGVERLIIESALDAEGQSFGWIIPLPGEPTEFEKVSPGFLQTLSLSLQPRITHDVSYRLSTPRALAIAVAVWALLIVFSPAGATRFTAILSLGVLLVCTRLPFLQPGKHMAAGEGSPVAGVRVWKTATVGSYELSVLEADNAEALNRWLDENGFAPLPQEGNAIVTDYIGEGWQFVAARLRREEGGLSVPHPLAMTLPTEKPVYPMRLTALAGSDVYLELFVAAEDGTGPAGGLDVEVCQVYKREEERGGNLFAHGQRMPALVATTSHRDIGLMPDIGHPAALEELWDGCTLTKLVGTLRPSEMSSDIWLSFEPVRPRRQHFFSHRGAWETGQRIALVFWTVAAPITLLLFHPHIRKKGGRAFGLLGLVLPVAAASILLLGGFYLLAPKVDVNAGSSYIRQLTAFRNVVFLVELEAEKEDFSGSSLEEIRQTFHAYFSELGTEKLAKNIVTGELIQEGDSPGDYTIFEDERGVVFRAYDMGGFPHDLVLRETTTVPEGVRYDTTVTE